MVRLARGLGIAGAAVLLAIPFIASAQEDEGADPVADEVGDEVDAVVTEVDAPDDDRPEGAGPSWYEGEPHTGEGPPPWAGRRGAGGPGNGGPPPWAGGGDGDAPEGAGPPWYEGDAHDGVGPPPWAGGPRNAERSDAEWSPGDGRPPWANGRDD